MSNEASEGTEAILRKRMNRRQAIGTAAKVATAAGAIAVAGVATGAYYATKPPQVTTQTLTQNQTQTQTQTETLVSTQTQTITTGPPAPNFQGQTLRIIGVSGTLYQALTKGEVASWVQQNGIKIVKEDAGTSGCVTKITATKDNPQYDVVLLDERGLWQLLPDKLIDPFPTTLEALKNFDRSQVGLAEGSGTAVFFSPWTLVYNTKVYPSAPSSFEVLWDPSTKGHQYTWTFIYSPFWMELMIASYLFGGGQYDVESGFTAMAKRVGWPLFASPGDYNQVSVLMQKGDLWVGEDAPLEGFLPFVKSGAPIAWTYKAKPGWIMNKGTVGVVKGHKADDALIQAFLEKLLSPQGQSGVVDEGLPPANQKTPIPPDLKPWLPAPDDYQRVLPVDQQYLAHFSPVWQERMLKLGFG